MYQQLFVQISGLFHHTIFLTVFIKQSFLLIYGFIIHYFEQ